MTVLFPLHAMSPVTMTAQPLDADYDIELLDHGVRVTFRPTASEFVYRQLADPADIAREGPLSRSPNVRHAIKGDTGSYDEREVEALAFRLASTAVGGSEPT